jgi:phage-related protein
MDAIFFYLIGMLPLIVAAAFWFFNKKVAFIEAIILSVIGFIVAGVFHFFAVHGMTSDVETWSGQITVTTQHSAWLEAYMKEIYRTEYYYVQETRHRTVKIGKNTTTQSYTVSVRKSREVFSHLEPRTRWHGESFDANDSLGRSYDVEKSRYLDILAKHGGIKSFPGNRTNWGYRERGNHMIGGDPNDYASVNKNNYVYPVTAVHSWENKVKASPSVFSYVKVPENMVPKLFDYPKNDDKYVSDRLVGAASWNITEWDQLNARVGPVKKVNVIAVNFGQNADSNLATWLESYWIGGKKNDLVICFGGGETIQNPKWCHTFGWTEKEIVKRNIDTIILENGIYSKTIPLIEKEIIANYTIKDWTKFDYLTVDIPFSYFVWCFIITIVIIGIWIGVALNNESDKSYEELTFLNQKV